MLRRLKSSRDALRFASCLVTALALLLFVPSISADIFHYRDSSGHSLMTDEPVKGKGYVLLKRYRTPKSGPRTIRTPRPGGTLMERRGKVAPLIERVADKTRIRPELLHAVVLAESAYDVKAVSQAGAMGLMQLMPATAEKYGVSDPFDATQNLMGGALLLRDLLTRFNYNLKLALAAYNAGANAVVRYGNQIPPFPETINYVDKVMAFFRANREVLRNGGSLKESG